MACNTHTSDPTGRVYAEPEAEVTDKASDAAVEEEEEDDEEEVLVEEPQTGTGVRTMLMLMLTIVKKMRVNWRL